MGKYTVIEDVYNAGGYASLDRMFHDVRMPHAAKSEMSPTEKLIWKRYLSWRWRHDHPEHMRADNRHWWRFYKRVKPWVCICKRCGKEFNAPRNHYKVCPACWAKPSKRQLEIKAKQQRKKARAALLAEVKYRYEQGLTQQQIATQYGVTQKTVSNWLNNSCK